MRQIKFRAWRDGVMCYYYDQWRFVHNGIYFEEKDCEDQSKIGEGKPILMQYTGLKDKNGKEIYEGDIVEYKENWLESESGIDERFIHEVSWEVESFVLKNHGLLSELRDLKNKIKVIGNIYENKDLLKWEN